MPENERPLPKPDRRDEFRGDYAPEPNYKIPMPQPQPQQKQDEK